MKEFKVVPKITMLDTCEEFISAFNLNEKDLVITSTSTWNVYFKNTKAKNVIFIRNYGNGEPTDEMAEAIYKDITKSYDRVIAIGGGTVLDVAKLFCLEKISPITDLFDKKFPAVKKVPLVLVPTTCGTGSEVTNISILEFKQRHTKFGLADDAIYADNAVLIPELLEKLPFAFFATSSIDALIHSVESYLSPKASPISQMYSLKAAQMILKAYQYIKKNGKEAKKDCVKDVLMASTFAGVAFGNAGCAAVHAMSYPLGAQFHVPHGEANYAMFTGVFKTYMEMKPDGAIVELNKALAEILGCKPENVYEEIETLLNSSILQKKSLSQYGMTETMITEFAESVVKNQQRLLGNNYVPFNTEIICNIYKKLF